MLWEKFALLKYTQVIIPDTKGWEINADQPQHKWQEQASEQNPSLLQLWEYHD